MSKLCNKVQLQTKRDLQNQLNLLFTWTPRDKDSKTIFWWRSVWGRLMVRRTNSSQQTDSAIFCICFFYHLQLLFLLHPAILNFVFLRTGKQMFLQGASRRCHAAAEHCPTPVKTLNLLTSYSLKSWNRVTWTCCSSAQSISIPGVLDVCLSTPGGIEIRIRCWGIQQRINTQSLHLF